MRVVPGALIVFALVASATALGLDVVRPGSTAGFGLMQTVLLLAGVGAALGATELVRSGGEAALRAPSLAFGRDQAIALGRYAAILGQMVLIVAVAKAFRLESPAFHDRILVLAAAGFAIHAALPMRWRMTFFLLLSLSGINLVFGAVGGLWLVGIGCALAGICHLPIAFGARVALLLGAGVMLALLRAEVLPGPVPGAIWPILGSMFMFRLIVYMYDLRHAKAPTDWRRTLAYFFLLPNVVFPLFPVVDWATFRRTYYDQESHRIYQRGVRWIARGITHLLLYRVVDGFLALSPSEVSGPGEFVRFIVANYLLYLRVSGQFHIIVGLLHLFGFRLPETHHWFFLASSFTDFWRRINIYWKDFMLKVVYYPAFFRLRRFGTLHAVVAATLLVFLSTWFLHAYQWFWLLGAVLLSWPDILFWTVLALLLVGNTLIELRRGQTRRGAEPGKLRAFGVRALETVAFFTVMCVLWSLWSSESVTEWLGLWNAALGGGQ
jgi:hypothetical protein